MLLHNVTRGYARYHLEKFVDPNFHAGELGGAHHTKFSAAEQIVAEGLIWSELLLDPRLSPKKVAARMQAKWSLGVTESWVRASFARWGWTDKKVRYWAVLKFTAANIRYYVVFV